MRRVIGAVVATAALMIGGTVVAVAAIPDAMGVIHGCYGKNGELRVVDPPSPPGCTAKERALTWSQKGQQGATGPAGPAGATGPPGPAGPSVTYVTVSVMVPGPNRNATVQCPADHPNATGGGVQSDSPLSITATIPIDVNGARAGSPNGPAHGWLAQVDPNTTSGGGLTVFAICAS